MDNNRIGLLIIAITMSVLGVLTGSLLLVGIGVAATVAAFHRVSESDTLPHIAGSYILMFGALLLRKIASQNAQPTPV